MKRNLVIAIAILSLLALAPLVAQGPPPGGGCTGGPCAGGPGTGMGPGGPGPGFGPGNFRVGRGENGIPPRRVLENVLNFTPEQFEALDALLEERRAAMEPLHDEIQALQEQLGAALESGAPDATTVGQLVIDLHNLRAEIGANREALKDAFLALLTEEQVALLEDLPNRRTGRGGRGGGPRGGGNRPGNGN